MTDFSQFQFKENIGTSNTPHTPGIDDKEPWEDQLNEVIDELMPHKRYKQIIIYSSIFAVYFFISAIIVNVLSNQIQDQCQNETICSINFTISNDIDKGIILYYEIDNFRQNQKSVYQSMDKQQLMGKQRSLEELYKTCGKFTTNLQMNKNYSIDGTLLNPWEQAIPCGFMAMSYFNDSFTILDFQNNSISIDKSGLATPIDRSLYFRNSDNYLSKAWQDISDQHFIIWMNPSAITPFRKPWGRISTTLKSGQYQLKVVNNYDTNYFGVSKSFVLVNENIFSSPKMGFVISHYLFGGFSLFVSLFSYVRMKLFWKSKKEHLS